MKKLSDKDKTGPGRTEKNVRIRAKRKSGGAQKSRRREGVRPGKEWGRGEARVENRTKRKRGEGVFGAAASVRRKKIRFRESCPGARKAGSLPEGEREPQKRGAKAQTKAEKAAPGLCSRAEGPGKRTLRQKKEENKKIPEKIEKHGAKQLDRNFES